MKISKDQQKEIRKKLIQAAVEVITEKGFASATMREISSKAELGTATIYNYFPTKEKILYGYFEEKHNELNEILDTIPDFKEFTLKEKLQAQMESILDIYLHDREFVQEAYKLIYDSPLRTFSEFVPIKKLFTERTREFIQSALDKNEIPDHPMMNFIINLYWDYCGIIILYWLRDDTPGFTNTSQLIDISLDIIIGVFKSGIIPKFLEIISFLFRSHLYGNIEVFHEFFSEKSAFFDFFKNSVKKQPADEKE